MAPSVQRRKVWLTLTTWLQCSNAAKTRKPLKFAGVLQTGKPISAASGPKFTILWGHVEDILLLNNFFPIVDTCLRCEDIARQSCAMVPRRHFMATFLRPVFSASRVQQVSDLHLKFALRPHHVWKYGRHPICGGWAIRRGKKEEEITNYSMKIKRSALFHRTTIINSNGRIRIVGLSAITVLQAKWFNEFYTRTCKGCRWSWQLVTLVTYWPHH